MNKVVYIADIDQDVDDIIAVDLLQSLGALQCVVLDPYPKSELGISRIQQILDMGVLIQREIPKCDYIFNGGAFTKLANYLGRNKVKKIVANGGFVGDNLAIFRDILDKFKGNKYYKTYNFNLDVDSALSVINSKNFEELVLIGKNVCHSERNTTNGIWKNSKLIEKYHLRDNKRLHDVLMVQEGLKFVNDLFQDSILLYAKGNPVLKNNENKGRHSMWGTDAGEKAVVAIGWK